MKIKALQFIFFSLFLTWAGLLAAQQDSDEPIVYADHKKISEDSLRADGHVEVIWQDYVIYADVIEFNLKTRELFAEGRVTMSAKDMVLSGEKLNFNLKTKSGELLDTYGLITPFVRYETDRLIQTDRETLTFQRLDFTSCAQIFPRWKITSRRGKIKKEKYIEMNDVLFRIKNIPVFYLPYLRYPIQKDGRATGLLFPNIGNSSLRGFFVQNSLFWAIKPNIDMTLGLDYFSELGIGVSDELRYLFRNASGMARYYYFRYRKDNEVYNDSASDYYVEANHKQTLPFLNSRLLLNVNRQSRPGFLRLFDNGFDRNLTTNFQSSLVWTTSFSNINISLSASRRETYYIFANSSRIVEYLPALAFNLNQQKLGKLPGYFSLGIDYQSVRRSGVTYEDEPEFANDFRSQRLTLTPAYQLPLLKLPWLNCSLNLLAKNTLYAKSLDPLSKTIVNEPLYMKYQTAKLSLQGPVFFRVYDLGRSKLKHVIEPEFEFRYATKVDNRDRLVPVDYFDYPSYSYAGFSLTSRLLKKGDGGNASAAELLTYRITQEYYFDAAEANLFRTVDGEYPSFSELNNTLRFRPGENIAFDASLVYNYYIHGLSRLNLRASYQRQGAPLTGSLSYSTYRNPYKGADYVFNRSILGGDINVNFPSFPLKLQAGIDYDFTAKEFRHGAVNVSFDYQCLVFSTEFKVFSYLGRSEFQFRFGLSLGNLGMVSDFFGGK
ncbi:MAG: LPS-assembly protein LptD [Chrysiogenales bacterium]|nr:MAG: LPS-assembly protein LptD [Chrysiogenales bacterium]